jgi:hypothetical protein
MLNRWILILNVVLIRLSSFSRDRICIFTEKERTLQALEDINGAC